MSIETIKQESDGLRGSLAAELLAGGDRFGDADSQLLKFHGIYQQDDRNHRAGSDRDYVFMVRAAVPGGVLSAEQYLVCDDMADWVGDGTTRITSRQGLQWHHIRKGSLRPMVWALNQSLVTTLGACGDVVRNIVACPAPDLGRTGIDLAGHASLLADRFRPASRGYWEIWVDGERTVSAEAPAGADDEPIYGDAYLPRKFKIGIAYPGDNCVDAYTNDVGVVPVLDRVPGNGPGKLTGFTVLVGGGQGRSHNRPSTYPRLADPLATVAPDRLGDLIEAVVRVQRDHGDRTDRKQARLKYLVDRWGLPAFRTAVEEQFGEPLPPAKLLAWDSHADHLGWHRQDDDRWYLGLPVPAGRIADQGDRRLRTALRTIADEHRTEIRFTPQQNVLLAGVPATDRRVIDEILIGHGVLQAAAIAPVVRNAMSCVALPTCGLALTDAERSFPEIMAGLDRTLGEVGLPGHPVDVRIVGCPNGCARPYSTEIGFVGRRKGAYDIHLGGAADGTRLNELFAELVPVGALSSTLRPLLADYATDRGAGETFGDWCHRQGIPSLQDRFLEMSKKAEVTA